jgi:hypothetical protein
MLKLKLPPKYRTVLCITVMLPLSACGTFATNFECPIKGGVHCKRVSEVNALVDSGSLPEKNAEPKLKDSSVPNLACTASTCCEKRSEKTSTTGTVLSIWMAPFTDSAGIVHSAHSLSVPLSAEAESLSAFSDPSL